MVNTRAIFLLGSLFGIAVAQAAPSNDSFTNRTLLLGTDIPFTGTNSQATSEPGEPFHAGSSPFASVWWTWTAPFTGEASLRFTSTTMSAPILAVYSGNQLTNLSAVASLIGENSFTRLKFPAVGGVTYQLAVDSYDRYTYELGGFALRLTLTPRSANDSFSKRAPIEGTAAEFVASLATATLEPGEPSHRLYDGSFGSVWWTWTAPATGLAHVENPSGKVGPALAVYTGSQLSTLSNVSRTVLSTPPNWFSFRVQSGTTYHLAVDAAPSTAPERPSFLPLRFGFVVSPTNDMFVNRTSLGTSTQSAFGNNTGATGESGEPYHDGFNPPAHSIWWTWTAPASGKVTLSSSRSAIATALGVYRGDTFSTFQYISGLYRRSPDRVELPVTSGTSYHFAVDSTYSTGDIVLDFEKWQPYAANDYFSNRLALTGSSLVLTGSLYGATRELSEPLHANSGGSHSVWYSWVAPMAGSATMTVEQCGSRSVTWPLLAVYTGSSVSALTSVASASGVPGIPAQVQFGIQAGTTYAIAVDDNDAFSENFRLSLSCLPPPPNDLFANRIALSVDSWAVVGSTLGATKEVAEPNHAGSTGTATVWYSWTAPNPGIATLTVTGTFNTVLAVYQGSSVASLTEAASNDDFLVGSTASRLSFTAQPGLTYAIAIAGRHSTFGDYSLELTRQVPPMGVVLTSPVSNAVFAAGSSLVLTAEGWDEDGEIVEMQFRTGTRLLATTSQAPYGVTLSDISPGDYSFTATAVDNDGNATSSAAIPVRVPPLNNDFTNRLAIAPATSVVSGQIGGASREPGEPVAFNSKYKSIWWSWVAPSNGPVALGATVTNSTAYLSVYSGDVLSGLAMLASGSGSPARLVFRATEGVSYAFCVEGSSSTQGTVTLSVLPPPSNNDFTNRLGLSGSTVAFTASNRDATAEANEPKHAGYAAASSVWWSWTAPESGTALVSGKAGGFSTTISLAVYRGDNLTNLTAVASNRNSPAQLTFPTAAGTEYAIALDSSTQGEFDLGLQFVSLPANDNFSQAAVLDGTDGLICTNNFGATKETGEPNHANFSGGASVWWRWQPQTSGVLILSNISSDLTLCVAIYRGTNLTALTPVVSSASFSAGNQLMVGLTAGTEYRLAIDHISGGKGFLTLAWTNIPAPDNDSFSTPVSLSGYGSTLGHNFGAGSQPGEPKHGLFADGYSVWYQWTALEDVSVCVAVTSSEFYPGLAIYTGSSISNLTLVTKSDELGGPKSLSFHAVAGTTYVIAVDSTDSKWGRFVLSTFSNEPPQVTFVRPLANAAFGIGEDVLVEFEAFDPDGSITNVFLNVGGTLHRLTNSLYQYLWQQVPYGNRTISATVIDNLGVKTTTSVSIRVSPRNDNFLQSAALVTGVPFVTANTNATTEPGEPAHAGLSGGKSVWWAWTAPETGRYCLTTRGSTFDTLLAVYSGLALTNLTVLAANNDAEPAVFYSEVVFEAQAGVTYSIAVDGKDEAQGAIQLAINRTPSNDLFANRSRIVSWLNPVLASNLAAGRDANEPSHAFAYGGKSLWWTWTAPHTGSYTLSTLGSAFDTLLAIYTGDTLTNLTLLAGNDDADGLLTSRVRFYAVAGVECQIAVDGLGDGAGDIRLRLLPNNPPGLGKLVVSNGQALVNFSGEPSRTNTLESSTDLSTWLPVQSLRLANPDGSGVFTNGFAPSAGPLFFRVRQSP